MASVSQSVNEKHDKRSLTCTRFLVVVLTAFEALQSITQPSNSSFDVFSACHECIIPLQPHSYSVKYYFHFTENKIEQFQRNELYFKSSSYRSSPDKYRGLYSTVSNKWLNVCGSTLNASKCYKMGTSLVINTLLSQCRGPGFNTWSRNQIPHDTTKSLHARTKKKKKKKNRYHLLQLICIFFLNW